MRQSTTPSLSQTIWARWAARQFLSLPIVKTLLPVTFGYSLSSRKNLEAVVMKQLRKWKRLWQKVIDTLTQEDFQEAFQKLLEQYNKCIAAGGDYFEGDESFMCVLSIKVPIQKKSGNLFNDPCIYVCVCVCVIVLLSWELSTLTKGLTATARIMQSSSNKLGTLVSDSAKWKQTKTNQKYIIIPQLLLGRLKWLSLA